MPKPRKARGPRGPTESHHFSVTRCEFWTRLSGGTPRDDTTYSASLTFYGTLTTPIRATTAIEAVVYLKDDQSYRSIDEAPAYLNRTTQKPVGWLDLRPEAIVVVFLPVPDFDRLCRRCWQDHQWAPRDHAGEVETRGGSQFSTGERADRVGRRGRSGLRLLSRNLGEPVENGAITPRFESTIPDGEPRP